MKIKRSSWHYKISLLGGWERTQDNLCCYFWRLVGKLAFMFCVFALVSSLLYLWFSNPLVISNTILLLFLICCVALPSLAIWYLREKIGKPLEIPYKIPRENILFEFIKAKKRKICPLIEYI